MQPSALLAVFMDVGSEATEEEFHGQSDLSSSTCANAPGIVIFNSFTPAEGQEQTFHDWYEKEYVPAVKEVAGFNRTRRFKLEDGGITGLKKDDFKAPPTYLEVSGKFPSHHSRPGNFLSHWLS